MPELLRPIENRDFKDLSPHQVRLSTVLEVGGDVGRLPGELGGVAPSMMKDCQTCEGCQSCQTCYGCQSCQSSFAAKILQETVGAAALAAGPVRIVQDVVYELAEAADVNRGVSETTQSRVVVEAPAQVYEKMLRRDLFVEAGTAQSGAKRYLLKRPLE